LGDPIVSEDRTFDVVIVGGGVIGLCSAYYLAKSGVSVAVLDKGEMGHGSSLHNAGYVSPSHFIPLAAPGVFKQGLKWMLNSTSPLYIKPRVDLDLMRWGLEFARSCNEDNVRRAMPVLRDLMLESKKLYEELARADGMDFELTSHGLTLLHRSERGKAVCTHEARLADEIGIEARLVDAAGLRELDPQIEFAAGGGLFFPGDVHLVPSKLIDSLTNALGSSGVALYPNTEVVSCKMSGAGIASVGTAQGWFKASQFVLAGGAWSPKLARMFGLKMLMQAGKGYSVTVRRAGVQMRLPYIFQERRVAVTPFSDSLRFAGTMEIAGINSDINRPRVEAILDAIPFYFRNVPRPKSEESEVWGGMRPVTPDGMPYLGRFRACENLLAATGHAMLGVTLAAVTGRIVCDLVRQRPTGHDLTMLNPDRFM
jgi:D-amino-acid dehydrogenase